MQIVFSFLSLFMMATLFTTAINPAQAEEITPSHVFAQSERMHADVLAIKAHLKLSGDIVNENKLVRYKPDHVWQKTYEILFKLHIFRRTLGYPSIAVSSLDPQKHIRPKQVYDQTRRILGELSLIKEELNITTPTPAARKVSGKTPSDVYHQMTRISSEIDFLNGQGFTPSHVFSQVIRINSDIDTILHAVHINDLSFPPIKNADSLPINAFIAGMELMRTIGNIQRLLGIDVSDFSEIRKIDIKPADVYTLIGLITAELQRVKFALSLKHDRIPASKHFEAKTPADVEQMMGWCNNKLKQIRSVSF